jgi:hypothetical protein
MFHDLDDAEALLNQTQANRTLPNATTAFLNTHQNAHQIGGEVMNFTAFSTGVINGGGSKVLAVEVVGGKNSVLSNFLTVLCVLWCVMLLDSSVCMPQHNKAQIDARIYLCYAVLCCAVLCCAVLCCAVLCCVVYLFQNPVIFPSAFTAFYPYPYPLSLLSHSVLIIQPFYPLPYVTLRYIPFSCPFCLVFAISYPAISLLFPAYPVYPLYPAYLTELAMRRNGSDDSLTVDDEYYTSGKSANNDFTLSTDTSPPCSLRLLREASTVEGEGEGEGEEQGHGQELHTGDEHKASEHKSSVSVGSSSKSGRDNGNDNAAGSTNETVDTGRSDSTLTVAGNNVEKHFHSTFLVLPLILLLFRWIIFTPIYFITHHFSSIRKLCNVLFLSSSLILPTFFSTAHFSLLTLVLFPSTFLLLQAAMRVT